MPYRLFCATHIGLCARNTRNFSQRKLFWETVSQKFILAPATRVTPALVTAPGLPRIVLSEVQHHLFDLGGELCIPGHVALGEQHVNWLERQLDRFNEHLPALKDFILPGGGISAAHCHLARTVCRRAERCVVSLGAEEELPPQSIMYLNRLSDLLFVLARYLAREDGAGEVLWQSNRPPLDDD